LSKGTIGSNLGYQSFQVADSNVVSDTNSVVTVDKRSSHQFQWRKDAVAYRCMGVEVVNHLCAIEDSTRFFLGQACA
jgi:hypothetical protein